MELVLICFAGVILLLMFLVAIIMLAAGSSISVNYKA